MLGPIPPPPTELRSINRPIETARLEGFGILLEAQAPTIRGLRTVPSSSNEDGKVRDPRDAWMVDRNPEGDDADQTESVARHD